MFNKFFTLSVSAFIALVFTAMSFGQTVVFEDNFDSYTAGLQLACQNPIDWTTWSNDPCNAVEDPLVSNNFALSGANSFVLALNNDLVKPLGTLTSGKWAMDFMIYIPTGKWGYFNTLAVTPITGTTNWGMQVYFEAAGAARMDAGGASSALWTYSYDTWQSVRVVVDLDLDLAEMWFDGVLILSWQWTLGTFGAGSPLQLDGNNFFGATADDEMYVDDYVFTDLLGAPPGPGFSDDFDAYTPGTGLACQNPTEWDTWSNLPCDPGEDPLVSDLYSYSGSNTVVIAPGNDLIRHHGQLTSGIWYISFLFYIPTGGSGYFNSMSGFTPNPFQWAHEVYFDVGGAGRLMGVPGAPIAFSWAENTWQQAVVVIDLDTDNAEFWFGNSDPLTMIGSWQWTQGGSVNLQLDATDFFGAAATEEMYVDDYYFGDTWPAILPVELTSFAANVNNNGDVILNWTTASELNNQMFEIERRSEEGQYLMIGYVNGHGTTTEPQEYSYIDNTVETGTYFYRLKQIDFLGTYEYSDEIEVEVKGPLTFGLQQNYPNPFNPSTHIKYNVPESGVVKLAIYNMLGEEVAVLVDGMVEAGFYEVTFNASNLPSGAYFYRLQSDKLNQVKKMLLMK